MARTTEQIAALRREIASISSWYHCIDLGDGVETPGHFRMRDYVLHYSLPERMDGMRVLDVGASNGYFAFEFERRGASEVVALELPKWENHDWTPRYRAEYLRRSEGERATVDKDIMVDAFSVVGKALGSTRVKRLFGTIYDLDPAVIGTFDIVFSGAMLMHVRDPILGVQRMRACTAPEGRLIISISSLISDVAGPVARFVGEWNQCNWWQMSSAALDAVLTCCDYDNIHNRSSYVLSDVTGVFKDPTYVCHATPRKI